MHVRYQILEAIQKRLETVVSSVAGTVSLMRAGAIDEESQPHFTVLHTGETATPDTVDALGQVIAGTENAADAFKKLAIEIVKSAITGKGAYADFFQSMFGGSGGGGLGNVLGGLLGFGGQKSIAMAGGIGLYAKGGISDRPAIFGEAGPEAAVPLPDGRSIPVDLRMSALPSLQPAHHENNQSATVFNFAPVINAPNADSKGLEQVEKRLDKMQREMPATVIETMRKAQNSNVKF